MSLHFFFHFRSKNGITSIRLQVAASCGFVATVAEVLAIALPGWYKNYDDDLTYNTRGLWNECKDFTDCRSTVSYDEDDADRGRPIYYFITYFIRIPHLENFTSQQLSLQA